MQRTTKHNRHFLTPRGLEAPLTRDELESRKQVLAKFHGLKFGNGGGLRAAIQGGNEEAINGAIEYLSVDPHEFHSGYVKQLLWPCVRRSRLNKLQISKLERVAIEYVRNRIRREFWAMARCTAQHGRQNFWSLVETLTSDKDPMVAARARWLYEYRRGEGPGEANRIRLKRSGWPVSKD